MSDFMSSMIRSSPSCRPEGTTNPVTLLILAVVVITKRAYSDWLYSNASSNLSTFVLLPSESYPNPLPPEHSGQPGSWISHGGTQCLENVRTANGYLNRIRVEDYTAELPPSFTEFFGKMSTVQRYIFITIFVPILRSWTFNICFLDSADSSSIGKHLPFVQCSRRAVSTEWHLFAFNAFSVIKSVDCAGQIDGFHLFRRTGGLVRVLVATDFAILPLCRTKSDIYTRLQLLKSDRMRFCRINNVLW